MGLLAGQLELRILKRGDGTAKLHTLLYIADSLIDCALGNAYGNTWAIMLLSGPIFMLGVLFLPV